MLSFQKQNHRNVCLFLAFFCLMVLGITAWMRAPRLYAASNSADIVVLHGKVYTVNARQPWGQAVAISGDKIVAVGSDKDIERYRGANTRVIDAAGRVVLPGFTDSHIHFLEGSYTLLEPDLNGARTIPAIQKRLQDFAAAHPGSGWIVGQGWTYDVFAPSMPDKKPLDQIFPDRPVYLESYDGHSAWVNSKALALAGITAATPDPLNGKIVRDTKSGEPTGALQESAAELVARAIPKPTREEKLAAIRAGLKAANQYGLVRGHSAGGDFGDLDLFNYLRREGELTVRFYVAKIIRPPSLTPEDLKDIERARARYHDDWIAAGAAKFFMDGVVESHTAAMLAPYSDDPHFIGTPNWKQAHYNQAVTELNEHGIQVFTHAIGDRGVRMALDGYQKSALTTEHDDLRNRIEHIETISPQDIPRFAQLNVIASMQPLHANPDEDTDVWIRNVGPQREQLAFAWKTLENAGAHLAFGSDWPVVTLNPWPGVQCAVTRQTPDGKPAGGWIPAERITVEQAIAGYTIGAAYAGHREKTEGSLEPGKLADLIIVSQNPFEVDPHKLGATEVVLTMVGGRVVYQESGAATAAQGKPGR
ncbi:MAG: amidohydrolase [Candidatus Acidiferrales bacterium]